MRLGCVSIPHHHSQCRTAPCPPQPQPPIPRWTRPVCARGSTRCVCAPCLGVGEGGDAELGRRGLAHRHRARTPQPAHMDRVARHRRTAHVEQRALRRRHPFTVLEVLDAERDACERAGVSTTRDRLVDCLGGAVGKLGVEVHERVERRVVGLDRGKALIERLDGLHLTVAYSLCGLDHGAHTRILPRSPQAPLRAASPTRAGRYSRAGDV